MIKPNKNVQIKNLQAYAPASTYNDEAVEQFYDDAKETMKRRKPHFSMVM